jgi:hypothetical protein
MPRLAERFNADEFGDRLLAAHVNGATVFGKDTRTGTAKSRAC